MDSVRVWSSLCGEYLFVCNQSQIVFSYPMAECPPLSLASPLNQRRGESRGKAQVPLKIFFCFIRQIDFKRPAANVGFCHYPDIA